MHGTPARGDYQYFDNVRRDQELRLMRRKVAEYESGEAIVREKERTEKWRCRYEREVKARKKDAAEAERERKRTAKMWQDANEDVHAENEELRAEVERLEARMQELEERNAELEQQNSDLTAANRTLVHRLGRNHTNSHVPSSGDRPGASVSSTKRHDNNSRAKTDRKPGGQPGHPHHARKKLTPTAAPVVHSEPPEGIDGNSEWYMTDEYVERDEVNARVTVEVIPHRAMIWKNRRTGETRVSPFPEGLHDETNYSRQTEAIVLMLTHVAHVATRNNVNFMAFILQLFYYFAGEQSCFLMSSIKIQVLFPKSILFFFANPKSLCNLVITSPYFVINIIINTELAEIVKTESI